MARNLKAAGDPAGVLAGVLFISIGAASVALAIGWRVGTAAQMGPGFFPLILGGLLIILGLSVAARAFATIDRKVLPSIDFRAVLPIICPILVFAVAIPTAGLLVSVMILVVLTRLADHAARWSETFALAAILALLVAAIFVVGLGLRVPMLPTISTGWFG